MAYEIKPGQFTLFKNDRKEKDTHPDYRGDGKDLSGNDVWVSAWIKEGAKGKFMSCSMQVKQTKEDPQKETKKSLLQEAIEDNDIPF